MKRIIFFIVIVVICTPILLFSDTSDNFQQGSVMFGGEGSFRFRVQNLLSEYAYKDVYLHIAPNIGFFPFDYFLINIAPGLQLGWWQDYGFYLYASADVDFNYYVRVDEMVYFYFGIGGGMLFYLPIVSGESSDFDFYAYLPLGFELFLTERTAVFIEPYAKLEIEDIHYEDWDFYTGISFGFHFYLKNEGMVYTNRSRVF